MKWKLYGVLIHGKKLYYFLVPPWVQDNANIAMTCYYLALQRHVQEHGSLPSKLYRQMDGGSDNTCRWNHVFMAHLVALGLADTVKPSRLPPGHSHEDIDQCHMVCVMQFRGRGQLPGHEVWAPYCSTKTGGECESLDTVKCCLCTVKDAFQTRESRKRKKDAVTKAAKGTGGAGGDASGDAGGDAGGDDGDGSGANPKLAADYAPTAVPVHAEICWAAFDFKEHYKDCGVDMEHFKYLRAFKLCRDDRRDPPVSMWYKDEMQHKTWKPTIGQPGEEQTDDRGLSVMSKMPSGWGRPLPYTPPM